MNIKNRIEKLENAAGVNSEFCACQGGLVTRMIKPDMDLPEDESERLIAEAQKPEFCELCHRQIEKQLIVLLAARGPDPPAKPGETFATFDLGR